MSKRANRYAALRLGWQGQPLFQQRADAAWPRGDGKYPQGGDGAADQRGAMPENDEVGETFPAGNPAHPDLSFGKRRDILRANHRYAAGQP